jgi:glycosyltransferase involved in cell wall biosynthesis
MRKVSDEEIRKLEQANLFPRVSLLEDALSADVLDERYLYEKAPIWRRWLYKYLPVGLAQILETLFIQHRYDVILSQSERVGLPLAFLMKYLRLKTPHVMVVSRITSSDPKKSKQKQWMLRHAKEAIARILIWSSCQRDIAIQKLGVDPEKIILLKRGTDQNFWKPKPAQDVMISAAGMEMRDYPTLVEALAPLNVPCHIAVATARGQLFDTVKRLYDIEKLPDNISVGRRPYVQLRELYAQSRFTVVPLMPTDSDNGLTAILESMAMGKPVICSRTDGQIDIIEDGVTGIYVPQGDPEALREAIIDLWNDPERCRAMGYAARRFIERTHNMEQFVEAIQNEVKAAAGISDPLPKPAALQQIQMEV